MNQDYKETAKNIYKEYRQVLSKVGEASANAQYIHAQSNWVFLLLVDYFQLHSLVVSSTTDTDRIPVTLRSSIQLLSNESFLHDQGEMIADTLDLFDLLESEISPLPRQSIDLRNIFQGFIYLPTRCQVIKCMIRYRPLDFDMIMDYLLKSIHYLSTKHILYLSDTVYAMIEEQPDQAHRIRYQLTELRILPSLTIRLTVTFCNDDYADFLNGVFNSQPSWFLQQSSTNAASFTKIKSNILKELSNYTVIISSENKEQQTVSMTHLANITAIIRALSGLVAFFGVKLTDQEIQQCLTLLGQASSEKLVKLLLCLVLISADQMMRHQKQLTSTMIQLIQNGNSEMPLLLMAYFQTDEIGQIEEMMRTILQMQVPIPKIGLFEMQKLFKTIDSYIV
ncbi:uncharacterized protein BX664DRAFT_199730 [Halteromyces radiatus]|uniref:uncharacterized protein n=1 Tax=Halteromyces radiatus TaxID=101107 RepID=UPI002220CBAA|nr:uncharacterized protein BX664DRAFT_199730 [Halteromyces radiatus]KAI8081736.1 hypothetical protein BX664DRAFT_199730 [Halteromyces radiatus]